MGYFSGNIEEKGLQQAQFAGTNDGFCRLCNIQLVINVLEMLVNVLGATPGFRTFLVRAACARSLTRPARAAQRFEQSFRSKNWLRLVFRRASNAAEPLTKMGR
jgi:hypothetical protein